LGNPLLIVKTAGDPLLVLPTIRSAIWKMDSSIGLGRGNMPIEEYLQQFSYSVPKFGLIMFGTFAGIGLVLVIIGVFSVMAYSVSVQTHEIGVRMALGAQRENILAMVIKNGLTLVAAGILVGVMASYVLTRALASQIWGVSPTDPLTFVVVVAVIVTVGIAACLLPARRATRVDPMVALRYE
jgi:putative ABC transport system permease protein